MNIVYLGSGQFGLPCLDAILGSRHKITLIITQPAQPAGRGRKLASTPAANWATEHSIPLIEIPDVNAPDIISRIREEKPDLIVVIAFGQKISKEVTDIPPKGAINVHGSLLPKYRGAAPINWAIINGDTETGISIIKVAERMDAGDILSQCRTEIEGEESAGELHDRLAELAAPLLITTIDQIAAGTARYAKQDDTTATRAPKLKKSDGFIDFNEPAEALHRKMRGLWPWPGVSAFYKSQKSDRAERVIFAKADILRMDELANLPAGTIDENLNVVCGKDRLQIMQLKPENSRLMSYADFVNGRRVLPGDRFVKMSDSISPPQED
jgi:methionyl-tRNA formyltransferase